MNSKYYIAFKGYSGLNIKCDYGKFENLYEAKREFKLRNLDPDHYFIIEHQIKENIIYYNDPTETRYP